METFPALFPLPSQDLSVDTGANSIRTKMDGGNIRQRRRFSTEIVQVRVTWELDDEQMGVFVAWHRHKINLGSDWFVLQCPLGGMEIQPHTVRFVDGQYDQRYEPVSNWRVSATLDVKERAEISEDELDAILDVDPLEGIGTLRLQTCLGWGINAFEPLGLYQDLACTVPATLAGDSIAAWRDEITGSGVIVSQADPIWRPQLQFSTNGVPVIRLVGFQQNLRDGTVFDFVAPYHFGVSAKSAVMTPFGSRCVGAYTDWHVGIGTTAASHITTFVGNGGSWNDTAANVPNTLWTGGHAVSMSNSGTVLQPYCDGIAMTPKVGIAGAANVGLIIGATYAGAFWQGDISAVIFGAPADHAAIDAFLLTLIPN